MIKTDVSKETYHCTLCKKSKLHRSIYSLQYHLTTRHTLDPAAEPIQKKLRQLRRKKKIGSV